MATSQSSSYPDKEAVLALFQSLSTHLRDIKQIEMNWLGLFSLLTVPAVGYMSVSEMQEIPDLFAVMAAWMIAYGFLTVFFQYTLCKERLSYYKVILIVELIQNHFNFIRGKVLPLEFACGAFPEGYGPTEQIRLEDNTQRRSSFTIRIAYTVGILVAILFCGWWRIHRASPPARSVLDQYIADYFLALVLLLFVADLGFVWWRYREDKRQLQKNAALAWDQKLLGADEVLYGHMTNGIAEVVRRTPHSYVSSYDAKADTLHISFKRPDVATDNALTNDDITLEYEGDELIGVTVLHASRHTRSTGCLRKRKRP